MKMFFIVLYSLFAISIIQSLQELKSKLENYDYKGTLKKVEKRK